jgi:hypothetical protein
VKNHVDRFQHTRAGARRRTIHAAGAIVLMACGSTDESPTRDFTWLDCMKQVQSDYEPLSAEEMIDAADVIARGHLTSVREGRVLDDLSDFSSPSPMPMMVMEVTTTDGIKGAAAGERVYFEEMRAACTPDEMSSGLPQDELLVFLVPSIQDAETHRVDFPDRGLPAGETLYVLRTPQALLLQTDGSVSQPLEPDILLFDASLDAVVQAIRGVLALPSAD